MTTMQLIQAGAHGGTPMRV